MAFKAIKIRMNSNRHNSNELQDIKDIYVTGCDNPGWFSKETLHDFLKDNPNAIYVNVSPFPYLKPAKSIYGEKYVKSEANDYVRDNLLKLPRE